MRLLSTLGENPTLGSFVSKQARPEYAILSHTWMADEDEVTFADLSLLVQAQQKPGWAKIQQARRLASEHGYLWIWIDTCCIDKSSSAELSEAINSMFRWYRDASICFVYLDDVPDSIAEIASVDNLSPEAIPVPQILVNDWTIADMEHDEVQYDDFSKCRWLTRGWTLQEMLAPDPQVVQFFNAGWSSLGSLAGVAPAVAKATGIDISVLKSGGWRRNPHDCSIAQRMSWAAFRRTTRVEDRAYSLLGLFGVNMPILYGEGHRAFFRLQEAIMRESPDDLTILFWKRLSSNQEAESSLLAECLEDFESRSDIAIHPQVGTQFELLTHGVRLTLPVQRSSDNSVLAALPCRSLTRGNMFTPCLLLERDEHSDTYSVIGRPLIDSYHLKETEMRTLTVRHVKRASKPRRRIESHGPIKLQSVLTTGINKILIRGSTLVKTRDRFTERGLLITGAHPESSWNYRGGYFDIPHPLPAENGFRAELSLSFHFAHNRETSLRLFVSLASVNADSGFTGYKRYEWTTYKRAVMDFASPVDDLERWTPDGSCVENIEDTCVRPWTRAPKGWEVEAVMKVMTLRDESVLVVELEAQATGEKIEYDDAQVGSDTETRPIRFEIPLDNTNRRTLKYRLDRE